MFERGRLRTPQPPDMTPALNLPVGPHHHFKRAHLFFLRARRTAPRGA